MKILLSEYKSDGMQQNSHLLSLHLWSRINNLWTAVQRVEKNWFPNSHKVTYGIIRRYALSDPAAIRIKDREDFSPHKNIR